MSLSEVRLTSERSWLLPVSVLDFFLDVPSDCDLFLFLVVESFSLGMDVNPSCFVLPVSALDFFFLDESLDCGLFLFLVVDSFSLGMDFNSSCVVLIPVVGLVAGRAELRVSVRLRVD